MPGHTLILLRHAKSAYPPGVWDHDRPLAGRGRREAALVGDKLRSGFPPVSAVLCSTALRTRQTLEGTGLDVPTTFSERIYEASPREILGEVALVGDEVDTLLVVGHAPGIPATALELHDGAGDPGVADAVAAHFPTSAFVVLSVPGSWADLAGSGARLTDFVIARD